MKTSDIALASFLILNGFKHTIEMSGTRGIFCFSGDPELLHDKIHDFHQDEGCFLRFHEILKSLKASIIVEMKAGEK